MPMAFCCTWVWRTPMAVCTVDLYLMRALRSREKLRVMRPSTVSAMAQPPKKCTSSGSTPW